jgi:hypothetical protein
MLVFVIYKTGRKFITVAHFIKLLYYRTFKIKSTSCRSFVSLLVKFSIWIHSFEAIYRWFTCITSTYYWNLWVDLQIVKINFVKQILQESYFLFYRVGIPVFLIHVFYETMPVMQVTKHMINLHLNFLLMNLKFLYF